MLHERIYEYHYNTFLINKIIIIVKTFNHSMVEFETSYFVNS